MDNEIFESLADLFTNDATLRDLHLGSTLRCDALDYSLTSLDAVDEFLAAVRDEPGSDHETLMAVLRAGSYLGEVIRRQSPNRINWMTFENAAPGSDLVRQHGKQSSTLGVLRHPHDGVTLPLGKIVKCLHFGCEQSVRFFAESQLTTNAR